MIIFKPSKHITLKQHYSTAKSVLLCPQSSHDTFPLQFLKCYYIYDQYIFNLHANKNISAHLKKCIKFNDLKQYFAFFVATKCKTSLGLVYPLTQTLKLNNRGLKHRKLQPLADGI